MKKNLLLLLLFFLLPVLSSNTTSNVHICDGTTAYAYHKTKDCSGIKKCKGEIKTITLEKAKEMKRTPCKICYK